MNRLVARQSGPGFFFALVAFVFLVGVGFFIGGGAGTKVAVVTMLLVGALWAVVLLARVGTERVATILLFAAAVFAPMNGLRPTTAVAVSDVFLLGAAGLVALDVLVARRPLRIARPGSSAVLGGIVVLGGGLLGTLVGGQQRVESIANLARFGAAAIGAMVVVLVLAPSIEVLRRLMAGWLAGASLSVLAGLAASNRVAGRSLGLTTHPNHLGLVSALSAAVALAFALSLRGWRRTAAVAALVVTSYGVIDSGSRAALLGLTVSLLFVLARLASPRVFLLSVLIVAFSALAVVSGVVQLASEASVNRLFDSSETAGSDAGREEGLSATIRTIESYPLTGIGFERAKQGHNVYLQIWSAAGIIGLAGFVMTVGVTVQGSWRAARALRRLHLPGVALLVGTGSGLVGFLVASAFQNVVWDRYLWLYIAIILAATIDAQDLRTAAGGLGSQLGHHPAATTASSGSVRSDELSPSAGLAGDVAPGRHGG